MGTFDNIYLNKIKKLQEENLKLKRILSEALEGTSTDAINDALGGLNFGKGKNGVPLRGHTVHGENEHWIVVQPHVGDERGDDTPQLAFIPKKPAYDGEKYRAHLFMDGGGDGYFVDHDFEDVGEKNPAPNFAERPLPQMDHLDPRLMNAKKEHGHLIQTMSFLRRKGHVPRLKNT